MTDTGTTHGYIKSLEKKIKKLEKKNKKLKTQIIDLYYKLAARERIPRIDND